MSSRFRARPLSVVPPPPSPTAVRSARRPLWDGLTLERIVWVTMIALVAAGSMVWFFRNDFLDLLVSTLCVAYTTMLLFTLAGNLAIVQRGAIPREAAQILAVIAGSALGTVVTAIVKGRSLQELLDERLAGFVATSGIGIGFGCVAVAVYFYRERDARLRADIARMAAEFDASRAREDKQMLSARLQLLQAQVEPHFLFNTLANVQHLTTTDAPRASEMLGSLIRYLRAALPQMREQASTLSREVEMVRAYLEIQRVRMGERLQFVIDLPPDLTGRPMPPMMLISLVENAIKHGIDPQPAGGTIRVSAQTTTHGVRVTVADTGRGLSELEGMGIGLANIRERLATLFGPAARLDLHENNPRGVVATIEWPDAAA